MAFFETVKITGALGATLDGTAGSPSAGVLTVQGVASGTAIAVTGTFWQATQPVSNAGTFAVQATLAAETTKVIGTVNQGTSPWVCSLASTTITGSVAVTGTFWQATQPVSGTFYQSTQPVSLADGSDITLGAKADAKSTATDTTAVSIMSVLKEISFMEQTPASRAVTNAGTFAVQAVGTLTNNSAAPTTNNLGVLPAIANAAHPTYTEGDQVLLSTDLTGAIRVTGAGGGTQYTDGAAESSGAFTITVAGSYNGTDVVGLRSDTSDYLNTDVQSWAGTALGAMANYGTSPGAVKVPGINAYVTNSVAVTGTFFQSTQPVSIADGSDITLGAKADAKSTATDTTAVSAMSVLKEISYMEQNPASRAVTNTGTFAVQAACTQTTSPWVVSLTSTTITGSVAVTGTFWQTTQPISIASGQVVSGAFASGSIASGAIASGAIASGAAVSGAFVDGSIVTLGAKADAKSTATDTTAISAMSVLKEISYMAQNPASVSATVTPAGSTIWEVAPTSSANTLANPFFMQISADGTHAQTVNSTTTSSKYAPDVNILSILGTAPTTAGKLDIKAANGDAIVEIGDGTHTVTLNSSTYSSKYGMDTNLLGTLGTAFSTAGKVDIKGADGDVFVRQTTASNLNCTASLASGSNTIGKVDILGNAGVVLDAVLGATKPANVLQVGGNDGTNSYALPLASGGGSVVVSQGTAANLNATVSLAASQTLATLTTITNAVKVEGNAGGAFDAATNAAPPANAVQIGYVAATALPSAFTATDLTPPMCDKFGRQTVVINTVRNLIGTATLDSSSSSAVTFISAGSTGVYRDILEFIITNDSATATIVSLSDGTNTYKFAIAANGGLCKSFVTPLVASSTATAWTTLNSAAVSLHYTAVFANNK